MLDAFLKNDGTFLLRGSTTFVGALLWCCSCFSAPLPNPLPPPSSHRSGAGAISMVYKEQVRHFQIKKTETGELRLSRQTFASLDELVTFHKCNAGELPLVLREPLITDTDA